MRPCRVQRPSPRSCRNNLRGPGQEALRTHCDRSESVLRPELRIPRVSHRAVRLAEIGTRSEALETAVILEVQEVVHLRAQVDTIGTTQSHRLAQPGVQIAESKCMRNDEALLSGERVRRIGLYSRTKRLERRS